jgi:hypothetical protein
MIFFTRELYRGIQPKSGWERRAENEWHRRAERYSRYYDVISPTLPAAVRRLGKHSLHDGVVRQATFEGGQLVLLVDTTNALGGFVGREVRLTFRGVANEPRVDKLVGQWWLYEEAHLCSRTRFNLQVLFEADELEVEADELLIGLSARVRRRTGGSTGLRTVE